MTIIVLAAITAALFIPPLFLSATVPTIPPDPRRWGGTDSPDAWSIALNEAPPPNLHMVKS